MPRHQGLDRGGGQIVGANLGERAAEAADRGPHGIAYKYITHRSLLRIVAGSALTGRLGRVLGAPLRQVN
jgi:hypothetical protein